MKMLEIIVRICAVYCAILVLILVYYKALLTEILDSFVYLSIWIFSSRKVYDDLMLQWAYKAKPTYTMYVLFGVGLACFSIICVTKKFIDDLL